MGARGDGQIAQADNEAERRSGYERLADHPSTIGASGAAVKTGLEPAVGGKPGCVSSIFIMLPDRTFGAGRGGNRFSLFLIPL
jgi:hypothetical protein